MFFLLQTVLTFYKDVKSTVELNISALKVMLSYMFSFSCFSSYLSLLTNITKLI